MVALSFWGAEPAVGTPWLACQEPLRPDPRVGVGGGGPCPSGVQTRPWEPRGGPAKPRCGGPRGLVCPPPPPPWWPGFGERQGCCREGKLENK